MRYTDTFVVAVNNYRATTQLLTAADIFLPGEDLPKLLEIDVRGDVGGIRELLGEYIRTVKGGTIEPHVNNNWKIVGQQLEGRRSPEGCAAAARRQAGPE